MIKKLYKPFYIFIFALLIALPVILPYFHAGYFPTHDGEWAVVRLGDMFRSLRDHQFPVRYSGNLNFGYGYPLFNFVYPAPYYFGVLLHFFRLGFVDTIKLLFALSVVVSAITMYLASSEIWKSKSAGVISSIFYVYLPYRIVDLYARGSIGESLSFALFPFIIYCAARVLDSVNTYRYIVLGSISYGLLIMTHNIMALLFTPLLFIFIFTKLLSTKTKSYLNILIFILLSYSLSAFFWIPALFEKHSIILSRIPIANRDIYFVNLSQLITPKWGYGLPDQVNGFSYQIGVAHVIALMVVAALIIYSIWFKKKQLKNFSNQFAAVAAVSVFGLILLMFSITKIIWQVTPLLKEINYPWTLLAPVGFMISLLAGFLWIQRKVFRFLVCGLCLVSIILILPYSKPQHFFDKGDDYYLTNEATTTSSQELMPLWVKEKPLKRSNAKVEIIKGEGSIENVLFNSKQVSFTTNFKTSSIIQVNVIYWAGWETFVDKKQVPISYNNLKGLMRLNIPSGKHLVELKFGETPIRLISDGISLVSLGGIVFLLVFRSKNSKKS